MRELRKWQKLIEFATTSPEEEPEKDKVIGVFDGSQAHIEEEEKESDAVGIRNASKLRRYGDMGSEGTEEEREMINRFKVIRPNQKVVLSEGYREVL